MGMLGLVWVTGFVFLNFLARVYLQALIETLAWGSWMYAFGKFDLMEGYAFGSNLVLDDVAGA